MLCYKMRFDKTEGGRINQRELYDVKPFVKILQQINHIRYYSSSIECAEEATWEEPDCNS